MPTLENHYSYRSPLIRASILGANDGIISLSGFLVGVISSGARPDQVILSGTVALVAGALSMGAGEYISVSTQRDSELADIEREKKSLIDNPKKELNELICIFQEKGLDQNLATEVAQKLSLQDPLRHHLHEELGLNYDELSKPVLASVISLASFSIGGGAVTALVYILPLEKVSFFVYPICIALLFILGCISSKIAGSSPLKGGFRISIIGCIVLFVSYHIGLIFS